MITTTVDGITIALRAIPSDSGSRRQREQAAVAAMLSMLANPEAILSHTPDGAPMADGFAGISVSHSRDVAAIAIAPFPGIGIDVEQPRPRQLMAVAERVLSPDEIERFGPDGLLQAWTLKEAAFKAAGIPIADLREIHLHPDGAITLRDVEMEIVVSHPISAPAEAFLSVVRRKDKSTR